MAGTLIVSNLKTDTDNTFIVRSNTGTTLFSANTTGIDVANSIGATAITSDKILSIANTKISGNIISSQITSVANTQITGNIISSQIASVNATTATSGTLPTARLPAGSVLQVASNTKTDSFTSTTTAAFTDITGFSVSITPTSATSKILVTVSGTCSGQAVTSGSNLRLVRDSTAIGVGDAAGSRSRATTNSYQADANQSTPFSMNFLDSPATTSATTYKVQFRIEGGTFYFNRAQTEPDGASSFRHTSTITLMEIAV